MTIKAADITGLVLAGGRGSRMGGVDKGLQDHLGIPLALHALRRLAPQVGKMMINANRNIATYESMGVPVRPDEVPDYAGPLAGMLAGLAHCETPYLMTVPCDTPNFPLDLVERLSRGLADLDGDVAMAFTREDGVPRRQPVFSLMKVSVRESLTAYVGSGQGNVGHWASQQRCAQVMFEDGSAFFNANTPADLAQLQDGAD
ncbi:MAG TPA: molybdenum cofactor guanylyltransferase MobA [Steroidobacteraceae bacterium]|jgi:molybdopterin-guanine dinucleotide biosynthesis protein A|nr:molybdenum cofactor guanylyltransferase MobA [Steroidobacteraceae bacterium]